MSAGWKTRGLYLHRTRKPHAVVGLGLRFLVPTAIVAAFVGWFAGWPAWWLCFALALFSGRHNAYVGQTSSRWHRDNQHRMGSSTYGTPGAAWADLDMKIYPIPCFFPRKVWAREFQEKLWIKLLLPVYNVEWNKGNPRKISRAKAQAQRWARQSKGWGMIMPRLARLGIYAAIVSGIAYTGWEKWL